MPGGVPRTSTLALNNATLLYVLALVDKGYKRALQDDPHLANGLNMRLRRSDMRSRCAGARLYLGTGDASVAARSQRRRNRASHLF
jgi:alanine dehydrogenase